MILAGLILPRSSGASEIHVPLSAYCIHSLLILDYSLIYYFALWLTLAVLSTIFMFIHGLDYVPWPRLLPLTETIRYNGPGFRSGYYGTGFKVDFSKLKSCANAEWVTKGIRRWLKLRLEIRIVFDSHPRPSYSNGAGMTVSPHLSIQADEFLKSEQQRLKSEVKKAEARNREQCGICMEEMPDDLIACPDPCGHAFCRECLRKHVTARLDERRFPILCPTCTAGKSKGKEPAGGTCCERTVNFITCIISRYVSPEVSQSLALDLGLTDEQYSIWTEMEMVTFAVLLCCRKYVPGIRTPVPLLILGIGANARCSWPETTMKKLGLLSVRFGTATMRGASSVSSRSTSMVWSTRAMVHRNYVI